MMPALAGQLAGPEPRRVVVAEYAAFEVTDCGRAAPCRRGSWSTPPGAPRAARRSWGRRGWSWTRDLL